MLSLPKHVRVFVALSAIDMRRSFDGLANSVRGELAEDPEAGHLYVFHSRRRHLVKILFFDKQGYCVLAKRLESGTFRFPKRDGDKLEVDVAALENLLCAKPFASDEKESFH